MSNDEGEHLSSEDLSRLAETSLKPDMASGVSGGNGAGKHLLRCRRCSRLLAEQIKIAEGLHRLEVTMTAPRSVECPPDNKWLELAGGLVGTSEAKRLTLHAATCDHCGPLLRAAMEDFSSDLSAEDRAFLEQLPISGASAQKKLAAQMARNADAGRRPCGAAQPDSRPRRFSFPHFSPSRARAGWVMAAAIALIVVIAKWFAIGPFAPNVDQLLARAYSENRPMELRIRGAEYAPIWFSAERIALHPCQERNEL